MKRNELAELSAFATIAEERSFRYLEPNMRSFRANC
jgi:hypothetical protein